MHLLVHIIIIIYFRVTALKRANRRIIYFSLFYPRHTSRKPQATNRHALRITPYSWNQSTMLQHLPPPPHIQQSSKDEDVKFVFFFISAYLIPTTFPTWYTHLQIERFLNFGKWANHNVNYSGKKKDPFISFVPAEQRFHHPKHQRELEVCRRTTSLDWLDRCPDPAFAQSGYRIPSRLKWPAERNRYSIVWIACDVTYWR